VRFTLEMLRDGKQKFVKSYGEDTWSVTSGYRNKKKLNGSPASILVSGSSRNCLYQRNSSRISR
jgi:hypothetical protein